MSTTQKIQFEQYNSTFLTNILSSHFIYQDYEKLPQLKIINLSLCTKNSKKIHFWYLYLLSMQKPSIKKFHFSWKAHIQRSNLIKPKIKSTIWQTSIKKKKNLYFLYTVLFNLFSMEHLLEKKILKFQENTIGIIIPSAMLNFQTIALRPRNNYFPTIPLSFWFNWTNITVFQKLFILRHWKILNQPKLNYLDEEWTT
jgi:hypothetical protein